MITIMEGLRVRVMMTKMLFLHRNKAWFAAVKRTRDFMDKHIDKVFADLEAEKRTGKKALDANGRERTDLLYTMAPHGPKDREDFRSQILNVFFSSNETTSILLSNVFFALARDPRVYAKLRKEVLSHGDGPITWEQLRSMAYLRYVLNESECSSLAYPKKTTILLLPFRFSSCIRPSGISLTSFPAHRVYPISLQTTRVALNDTTLPVGGGPTGKEPIFIQKGDIVNSNRYLMHRDLEYWGDDGEEFWPERWETARPYWKFVPFGGGPRICPAHVLVDTECSYMIFKIVREFESIEARDDRPYQAVMRAGPSNLHGVNVAFKVAV